MADYHEYIKFMPPFRLTRRDALRLTGLGIGGAGAGCIGTSEGSGTSTEPPPVKTPSPAEPVVTEPRSPTNECTPVKAESGTASNPTAREPISTDEFQFDATVLQQFTADYPARVRFSFSNTTDRTFFMSPKNLGPYRQDYVIVDASTDSKLVFLLPSISLVKPDTQVRATPPSEPLDGCWTLNAEFGVLPRTFIIGDMRPGETIAEDYTCYAHRDNEDCLRPGSYRFTEEHDLRAGSIGSPTPERASSCPLDDTRDDEDRTNWPLTHVEYRNTVMIDDNGTLTIEVERSMGG